MLILVILSIDWDGLAFMQFLMKTTELVLNLET